MAWTRATLVAEFRVLADQPHTAIITAANAASLVNNAYRELLGKILQRNPRYFHTTAALPTVAASRYSALPADCVAVNKIVDSAGVKLPYKDMESFAQLPLSGQPTCWDKVGQKVMYDTAADAIYAYTLHYHYMPIDMASDAAVPEFVPGYEDLIAALAAIKSKLIRDDKSDLLMLYPERVQAMLQAAGTRETAASRRVMRSEYWDSDL